MTGIARTSSAGPAEALPGTCLEVGRLLQLIERVFEVVVGVVVAGVERDCVAEARDRIVQEGDALPRVLRCGREPQNPDQVRGLRFPAVVVRRGEVLLQLDLRADPARRDALLEQRVARPCNAKATQGATVGEIGVDSEEVARGAEGRELARVPQVTRERVVPEAEIVRRRLWEDSPDPIDAPSPRRKDPRATSRR